MLSIVVPVYNEEESLEAFYDALTKALSNLNEKSEIVFVDDGSTDRSLELLQNLEKSDTSVRVFSFRKNMGKAEALTLGFQKAKGERIVTLDADLQDDPEEIGRLLEKLNEFDLVCGWRKNRKDPAKKILSSKLFNFLAKSFWGLELHDYNCGLKAYKAEAAKSLTLYGGFHRFIPLLVYQEGFSVTEEPVKHHTRKYGKSKYGFSKLWKDLPDIFTMMFLAKYSSRPLHFFGSIGFVMLLVGFLILSYLTIVWFTGESIGNRPLLLFGILFVLSGLQIFMTGFLAELFISLSSKRSMHFPLKYSSDTT
jgi:glycosyltransferase involved in cell wall biosynthesis